MESKARDFPEALKRFIATRDGGICRTAGCDAPVRHADHAVSYAAGGETSAAGGQGLCEACNYAKQAPGWRARPSPTSTLGDHEVEITTPTGHTYRSKAPPLPGTGEPTAVTGQVGRSTFEMHFTDYLTEYEHAS
jgi:hypothetical protein